MPDPNQVTDLETQPQPEAQPQPDPAAERLAALEKQLAEERRNREQERAKSQSDLQQVVQYFQGELARAAKPADAPADPDEPPSPAKIKQEVVGEITESLRPLLASQAQALLATRRQIAADKLPNFSKYADEIDRTIEQLTSAQPAAVNHPQLYETIYRWVRSNHVDDETAAMRESLKAEIMQELQPQRDEDEVEPYEAPPPVPRREAPAPAISAAGNPQPRTRRRAEPLTREEEAMARRFGMTPERYRQAQTEEAPDLYGFKGRDRV